jgi:hypothetical protein
MGVTINTTGILADALNRIQTSARHPARFLAAIFFVNQGDEFIDYVWADTPVFLADKVIALVRNENGELNPYRNIIAIDTATHEVLGTQLTIGFVTLADRQAQTAAAQPS